MMDVDATEEFFDNLMKDASQNKEYVYGESDSDIETDVTLQGEELFLKDNNLRSLQEEDSVNVDSPKGSEVSQNSSSLDKPLIQSVSRELQLDSGEDVITVETITVDITQDDSLNSSSPKERNIECVNGTTYLENQDFNVTQNNPNTSEMEDSLMESEEAITIPNSPRNVKNSDNPTDNISIETILSVENQIDNTSQKLLDGRNNIVVDTNTNLSEGIIITSSDDEEMELSCRSFKCSGCEANFCILRFYYQHISRQTCKILYHCKKCNGKMKFTNMCLLKIHIKSHGDSVDHIQLQESNLDVTLPSVNQFKKKFLMEFKKDSILKALGEGDIWGQVYEDKKPVCMECSTTVDSITDHLTGVFDESHKCSECNSIMPTVCSLNIHKRLHSREKPYCCPECGHTFITHYGLVRHLLFVCYHFRRSLRYKCTSCEKIINSKKALLNHIILNHHFIVVMYKCKVCFDMFNSVTDLKSHMTEKHLISLDGLTESVYHKCDFCPPSSKKFTRTEFRTHIKEHMDSKECVCYCFQCVRCSFSTHTLPLFLKHLKTSSICQMREKYLSSESLRTLKRRNDCDIPKTFSKQLRTLNHDSCFIEPVNTLSSSSCMDDLDEMLNMFSKRAKPACDFCSSKFWRDYQLVEHMKKYHNLNESIVKCKCLLCGSVFNSEFFVKEHITGYHKCKNYQHYMVALPPLSPKNMSISQDQLMMGKTEENPIERKIVTVKDGFSCPSCDYIASSKEDFRTHVVEHREDGAYQCLECGECFVSRSPLEIHLISSHSIKDASGYITSNQVHNPRSELRESLLNNQCSVCFDVFPDDKALHLHFRSHGMAFLKQNAAKKKSP